MRRAASNNFSEAALNSSSSILSYGRTTLSGWLWRLYRKYGSRKEHQNRLILGNRTSECNRIQILRAQLRIIKEKLKYLTLYFSGSGMRGAFIAIF